MSRIQEAKDRQFYTTESPSCRYCGHHIWDKGRVSVSAGICQIGDFPVVATGGCDRFERCKKKDRCRETLREWQPEKGVVWLAPYEHLNSQENYE